MKSYSLENSLRESIFREDLFLYNCLQVKQLNDFNRKVAMEKELEKTDLLKYNNIAFDKSGNFIVFASLAGIKVVNIVTDKVVRVLGRPEHLRFLQVLACLLPVTGKSIKFVDFQIVVQLILVLVCLRISCTTTKISTTLRLLPETVT